VVFVMKKSASGVRSRATFAPGASLEDGRPDGIASACSCRTLSRRGVWSRRRRREFCHVRFPQFTKTRFFVRASRFGILSRPAPPTRALHALARLVARAPSAAQPARRQGLWNYPPRIDVRLDTSPCFTSPPRDHRHLTEPSGP